MKIYICKCGHEEEVNDDIIDVQFKRCKKCKLIGQWLLWAGCHLYKGKQND